MIFLDPLLSSEISVQYMPSSVMTSINKLSHIDEPYYCSQQIQVPPEYPDIVKEFTKAAVRTQPKDVLSWSAAYFDAIAQGQVPPVKDRVEIPRATQKTDTGLTMGIVKMLNKQLGPKKTIVLDDIFKKMKAVSLPAELFHEICRIGSFTGKDVLWLHFLAVMCTTLGENVTDSMRILCEVLTADPDGGPARIPFPLFMQLYEFLASIDSEISRTQFNEAVSYLESHAARQRNTIQPMNFLSVHCPRLY